ncbi:hypothetical protein MMAG44476_13766 [Mycolicibacterium mageritense DSM 44476 = CIP 104973]|uniref:Aconitate isomerase n=1 Tax=Mycolicibacterium mageritense TaxID=53462 RepID=A0AAI8TVH3_MYCME|nr:substrate-binding domain-containing protein [Mycolicibacterium mageritense]MCC9181800.1 substrate-binding domain-containing protein [Mycolicibacterium mageritense]CDO21160.1 hypothetical protein BN978_01619 [Mycolicibacterium mageritense DSM 44476 = CIP 104973]BBX34319.1 molybdate ABC transporter substrate-binding protein [Mycolicibacterium mageritense]BDY29300.1 Aconitate isomerase [Mycolicibacterium mageritense]GJJ18798.1 molybdate ABC transporter substrate-binding protein [Mycolicibacter
MTTGDLVLFSTLAVQGPLEHDVLPALSTEFRVRTVFEPTAVLLQKIDEGERPDTIVAVSHDIDGLRRRGLVGSSVAIASTGVGLGVAAGGPRPDLSTVPRLIAALKAARSVAYSRSGASGKYFAKILDRLGIADEINSRATIVEKGFTGLAVLDGRADMAIQQISELKFVEGIEIAGALPAELQHRTEFSAACFVGSGATAPALLQQLTTAYAGDAYRRAGLDC